MNLNFKTQVYVFKELFSPFILSLFIFLFTILMIQMFRFTDIILLYGSDIGSTSLLLKSLLVSTFPIILPLSLLSGILLGYGRLSQDSELIALSSLSLSVKKLIFPSVILTLLLSFFSYYSVTHLGPLGTRAAKVLANQMASETLKSTLKPGVFLSYPKMTVYVEDFDTKTQKFKNLFVLDQRKKKNALVLSNIGQVVDNTGDFSYLKMTEGQIHYNPRLENHAVINFGEYDLSVLEEKSNKKTIPVKALTNKEIFKKLSIEPNNFEYRFEVHKRFQLTMVVFVFLFLGLAFGFNIFNRVSKSESLGVCIMLAMSYWIFYFIFESISSNSGILFFVYLPNITFTLLALIYILYRNSWNLRAFK